MYVKCPTKQICGKVRHSIFCFRQKESNVFNNNKMLIMNFPTCIIVCMASEIQVNTFIVFSCLTELVLFFLIIKSFT